MRVSYSRIETFKTCPYKYKLKYLDELETKFNLDPSNALVLGTAVHTGIEKDVGEAIEEYYSNYPSATPQMINEAIKLEIMIGKAKEILPKGEYELRLKNKDFIGYIDLLVEVDEEIYDLYDFKYSNNVANYLKSEQLHIYKYWFEKLNPTKKIRNISFVFVPKVKLKQEEYETIEEYRERLIKECESQNIKIVPIEYDPNKVINFLISSKHCIECQEFNKKPNKFCYFCDFKNYCKSNGTNDGNIIYPIKIKNMKARKIKNGCKSFNLRRKWNW